MNLVKTNRETLLKPLQAVSGIIERRHTLPILSNVLLQRSESRISFVATDIEIEITAEVQVEGPGESRGVTVGARKLLDILRALPDSADISLALQDKRLQVKSGKSRFNLQTLPPEDFPRMSSPEGGGVAFSMPQGALKALLALVQYAMAQQDIRYYLNGLLLSMGEEALSVVATDGHRLALASLPGRIASGKAEVILPRKAVLELCKLLAEDDAPVSIEVRETQVLFAFGSIEFVTKVVDGKFPDYQKVIPSGYRRQFSLDRGVLQQALQRAAILSNEKFRGVRWVITENSLRIVSSNTEQEEAEEELEIEYADEPMDIGFNVSYLLDVLANVNSNQVECALGDANSSMLITVADNPNFKYVVMPMRI
jgi:DNA polymerase-3 subunit beta